MDNCFIESNRKVKFDSISLFLTHKDKSLFKGFSFFRRDINTIGITNNDDKLFVFIYKDCTLRDLYTNRVYKRKNLALNNENEDLYMQMFDALNIFNKIEVNEIDWIKDRNGFMLEIENKSQFISY